MFVFEGATDDAHETTLTTIDPTGDRTISLPNVSGTLPDTTDASTTQITSTPEELNHFRWWYYIATDEDNIKWF